MESFAALCLPNANGHEVLIPPDKGVGKPLSKSAHLLGGSCNLVINTPACRRYQSIFTHASLPESSSVLLSCLGMMEVYGGHPCDTWRASSLAASTLLSLSTCSLRVAASTATCRSCCPVAQHKLLDQSLPVAAVSSMTCSITPNHLLDHATFVHTSAALHLIVTAINGHCHRILNIIRRT